MPDTYAVGVCGFGRCGSTMVMAMLNAGGLPPVPGSDQHSFELPDPDRFASVRADGHAVKLLDHFTQYGFPQAAGWRFVWLDRDPVQQARSHAKFGAAFGMGLTAREQDLFARSYAAERPAVLGRLRALGPVLVLDYERVLAAPRKAARLLRREMWPGLDVDAATLVVHSRTGECRPDLSFELEESA